MVSLQDLTVGQVSGMIAAAVFIVQFLVPVALPIILLGLLRPRSSVVTETAVSWSVIGRYFQSSLWPLFLQTDSAATGQANKSILFMSFFKTFMMILIAIAAIITPLGLYEGIVADSSSSTSVFHYIKDASPMGYGTAPRTNNTWSRICGSFAFMPCPNDNNRAEINDTRTGLSIDYKGDWYDTRIPQKVIDVFQSGTADMADSVSSSFDIQYRSYIKGLIDDVKRKQPLPAIDNGTARTVGTYQPLASFVLNEGIYPVEGLVIDMKTGGIGFRNHSAPTLSQYGSTWDEDILFIVPETVCVNTNLTLDFQIPRTQTENTELAQNKILKPEIIDHGGFVNLNTTYPLWNIDDTQKDPSMYYRAYRGAWLSNAYTMAYMNVTNFANATTKTKAFSYLNSTMGKAFPLYWPDGKSAASMTFLDPNSHSVSQLFGDYLTGTEGSSNITGSGNTTKVWNFTSKAPLFSNPGNISKANFSTIDTLCRGQGGLDLANITNIATKCGFLYGAPQRKGGSDSPIFDPGSAWSVPMYSCVSATKAMIKTVSFRFNGTKDDLSGLEVVSLTEKKYPNEESKPLWGVEQTSMYLRDTGPLWGLVSKDSEKKLNISTLRKEHLYLPGRDAVIGWRNTPGADFYTVVLDMVYSTGGRSLLSGSGASVDYTGRANLAMYKKWQELSKTPETSAKILNLIWTDIASNMVVGTKGLQPSEGSKRKRDDNTVAGKSPEVVNYTRRVRYKWPYGIPAFIAIVLVAVSAGSTFFFVFFAGATPDAMRTVLQHTSVGRLLTSQAKASSHGHGTPTGYRGHSPGPHGEDYTNSPTNVWSKGAGKQQFTLGAEGWMKSVPHVPGYEEKGGATASYAPVPNPQGY